MKVFFRLANLCTIAAATTSTAVAHKITNDPRFLSRVSQKARRIENDSKQGQRFLEQSNERTYLDALHQVFQSCQILNEQDAMLFSGLAFDQHRQEKEGSEAGISIAQARSNPINPNNNQQVVIYRLCHGLNDITGTLPCEFSCDGDVYGEYMISLEDYLDATVSYQHENQKEICKQCSVQCDSNNNSPPLAQICETCINECQMIENMEENGYIDATVFVGCQMIYAPEDDAQSSLYAGPMCASNRSKINIGVFKDKFCTVLDDSKNVEDFLFSDKGSMKLSHHLLKKSYSSNDCVSCLSGDYSEDSTVLPMCTSLYDLSTKCEQPEAIPNQRIFCDFLEQVQPLSVAEPDDVELSPSVDIDCGMVNERTEGCGTSSVYDTIDEDDTELFPITSSGSKGGAGRMFVGLIVSPLLYYCITSYF